MSCTFLVLKKTTAKEDQAFQVKGDGCKASNCTATLAEQLMLVKFDHSVVADFNYLPQAKCYAVTPDKIFYSI